MEARKKMLSMNLRTYRTWNSTKAKEKKMLPLKLHAYRTLNSTKVKEKKEFRLLNLFACAMLKLHIRENDQKHWV
jgi:hypothetical protein